MVRHRFRGGGRRAGPTPLQLEMMSMPQSGLFGYYFPYNSSIGGYDSSTFVPDYSDGIVTKQDVDTLLNDLNQQPDIAPVRCDPILFLIPLIAIGMFVGFFVFIFGSVANTSSRSTNCDSRGYCKSEGPSVGGIIGTIMGINLGGIFLIMVIACCAAKRARERLTRRNKAMTEIIAKHQQSTFANKNVIARVSNQGGYVAIEFKWRVNQAMPHPAMNPMGFMGMQVPAAAPFNNQFGGQAFMPQNPQHVAQPYMPPQQDGAWSQSNTYKPPMTTITSAPVF